MTETGRMHVGSMIWRIGDRDNFWDQLEWLAEHNFDGVAFHTAPTFGGDWASFDVREASDEDRRRLEEQLQQFRSVTIHTESFNYDIILESPNEHVRAASVQALEQTIELASEIDAAAVTVHRGTTSAHAQEEADEAFAKSVEELSQMAADYEVRLGFEIEENFGAVVEAKGPIGVTLDTGHLAQARQRSGPAYPAIPRLVELLGESIIHTHFHDFDGQHDHLALGEGRIDFEAIIGALSEVGYTGMLCLEMNPDCTSPEQLLVSKRRLEDLIGSC